MNKLHDGFVSEWDIYFAYLLFSGLSGTNYSAVNEGVRRKCGRVGGGGCDHTGWFCLGDAVDFCFQIVCFEQDDFTS